MSQIQTLTKRFAQAGRVRWLGVRPKRREPVISVQFVDVTQIGLDGDHRSTGGKRSVTLIQWEHLCVIGSMTGGVTIDPADLRRNVAVSGINLLALRKSPFRIGTAVLQGTGICAPCTRMEEALGPGGFNAMRGHGGITADILTPGQIAIGDPVTPA